MADEFAAIAVAQNAIPQVADHGHPVAFSPSTAPAADRIEQGIQLLSRWAGIAAFVGTVAGIAYLAV